MFVEELAKIRESEAKADEIQKAAKLKSRQSLRDARSEAAGLIEEAEFKAKEIYDGLIKEGQEEADAEYEGFMKDARKQCGILTKKARENEDRAVGLIKERIVGSGVDR